MIASRSYLNRGLTPQQVSASRQKYGGNTLTEMSRKGFFGQFIQSFGDPIIKVLLAALCINVVFLFRDFDWYETVGIAIAIFLATFVSTLSEYGSESAFVKLQQDAAKISCRVRRAGMVVEVPIGEVVVGDIVLLQAGERLPADGVLITGKLQVDQSALNGESKEAEKLPVTGGYTWSQQVDFLDKGRLFRGSIVTSGEGCMEVRAVGDSTFYGSMAREVQEETRESPLRLRLGKLAGILSRMGYCAAALVATADLFNAFVLDNNFYWPEILQTLQSPHLVVAHLLHAITLAITVVVVAVPEGLPMMITVVLSSNMRRMLGDHVLVRKLVGIETSGSLNILFTDKTGTLTKGQLEVVRFLAGDGEEYTSAAALQGQTGLWELVRLCAGYNTGSQLSGGRALGGNATDRALLDFIAAQGPQKGYTRSAVVPFDSARKYAACRVSGPKNLYLVKGAPEKLLANCTRYYDAAGTAQPLRRESTLRLRIGEMTRRAVRVLALATSDAPVDESGVPSGLTLIGLVGIRDEVRPEAKTAVRQIQRAGVQVVMITGDNRDTAAAIAAEAGLLGKSEADTAVIDSAQLAAMSDSEVKRRLPGLRVVARALPTDKSRLVQLAQSCGLVAGMTGDGINDAPALKRADVGFAMGSGTEVAKEAGDIVILNDNIASIGRAILYGRTIFESIRKFIVFQLTMNLCAVGVSIIGPFIGIDTPVTVMQMLWINIIMDTLAGLAFAGEPPLDEYMEQPPKRRDEPILNRAMAGQILWMGLYTVGLCVAFLKVERVRPLFRFATDPIYFLTAFFALFIFSGIANSFNARTHRLNLTAHLGKNPAFITIMAAVCAIQMLLIYFGGSMFRVAGLQFKELVSILLLALTVVPVDMLRKLLVRAARRRSARN